MCQLMKRQCMLHLITLHDMQNFHVCGILTNKANLVEVMN